jgi:hypothetical protein
MVFELLPRSDLRRSHHAGAVEGCGAMRRPMDLKRLKSLHAEFSGGENCSFSGLLWVWWRHTITSFQNPNPVSHQP